MAKKSAIEELGISTAAAAGSGVLGGLVNQLFAGANDKRQIKQQQKLTDMQVTANKQMADYEQELGLKMWKDTNYPAQVEMMKAAGLNPAAVLSNGGGGSGATGASAAGVAGGQAANAAQTQANQNELGLQMAQMQLMQAQTEKTKAEAENIAGVERENKAETTRGIKFNNDLNDYLEATFKELKDYEATQKGIEAERANALWESDKAAWYGQQNSQQKWAYDDPDAPRVKWLKSEMEKSGQELKAAKTANNIAKAEQTMKEFEAKLTKSGIAPGSPWYVKMMTDLAAKIGINVTGDTAKQVNKLKK